MTKLNYTGGRLVPGPRYLDPMRVEMLARYEFFLKLTQEGLTLDLGCGSGEGTHALAYSKHGNIIGVDVSYEAVSFASQTYLLGNLRYIVMNAEEFCFANSVFTNIISVEVIEHLESPEKYLENVARVMRPDGIFVLTTPNKYRSSPRPGLLWPEHKREYTPEQLMALLGRYFSKVEIWGQQIPLYENHFLRKLVRTLAPIVKPILPHWLRIRALPMTQATIKSDISIEDVQFIKENIQDMPTLVAVCQK